MEEKMELPRPMSLFDMPPNDTSDFKWLGFSDEEDCKLSVNLYRLWELYGKLVQDDKLWESLNAPGDSNSEKFMLQSSLVSAINELGFSLSDVPFQLRRLRR